MQEVNIILLSKKLIWAKNDFWLKLKVVMAFNNGWILSYFQIFCRGLGLFFGINRKKPLEK